MLNCNDCKLYIEEYDNIRNEYEDIRTEEVHHCPMYEDIIPKNIWANATVCRFKLEK